MRAAIPVLLGPTAVGKTALTEALAARFSVEVVSIDSALIYRAMNIGTAKPCAQLCRKIPHHLIDLREPFEHYSVAQYCRDAIAAIGEIRTRGAVPLITGGTMLYFRALSEGLSEIPQVAPEVDQALRTACAEEGIAPFYLRLCEVDRKCAERIDAHDQQRILRALAVYQTTGRPMSYWQDQPKRNASPWPLKALALLPTSRSWLHQRIAQRFDQMMAQGFVDEVRALMQRADFNPDSQAMRAVGYRQMIAYLDGRDNYEQMREKSIAATRQLAKRQLTWLRNSVTVTPIYVPEQDPLPIVQPVIEALINE